MQPKTKYAHSGDLSIAYQVFGDGPGELVVSFGPGSHVEHLWEEPLAVRFYDRLASFARVLVFDRRGTGASDPVPGAPTLEQQMEDMGTAMEAARLERPILYGESNASRMCAMFAATYPDRVSGMVLYAASAVGAAVQTPELVQLLREVVDHAWGEGELVSVFAPSLADDTRFKEWLGRFERHAASPGMARQLIEMDARTDIRSVLPTIKVPTLVLHRRDDPLVAFELGREVAEAIPGATFTELQGGDNISFVGDSEAVLDAIEEFVTGDRHHHEVDRVLSTLLFTDVVESTQRAATLGDRRWRDLLSDHDRRVRHEIDRYRGREIRKLGDGFLATFEGPARAIRCAGSIREALDELGVGSRLGLHTGEVEVVGGDVAGMAVHIAARVAARANPGEILVSGTVKDLVVGSGLAFADRGEHELKGVPDTWRLYAVES